jgi:hypothetical protein
MTFEPPVRRRRKDPPAETPPETPAEGAQGDENGEPAPENPDGNGDAQRQDDVDAGESEPRDPWAEACPVCGRLGCRRHT